MNDWDKLYTQAESLLSRLGELLPAQQPETGWATAVAFRWRKYGHMSGRRAGHGAGFIQPVVHPHHITLDALQGIDAQKRLIDQNTRQFVQGHPANNVLLTGARGTGKSSLVKAMLTKYAASGLRLIEVEKHDLTDLHDIVEQIFRRPERFILYCDDLSFESGEAGYKTLKVVLDGSIATASENVLIYATSNRRHLMPEFMQDNRDTRHIDGEIHPSEALEEKISLSERFGLWVSFYPFDQDQYLDAVRQWLTYFGVTQMTPAIREAALRWALGRGSRSGRVAWQFARDWAGKKETGKETEEEGGKEEAGEKEARQV